MHARHHTARPTPKAPPASPQAAHDADPAQRRASNLAALREMIDLGMQMTRAAAAEVLDPQSHDQPHDEAPPAARKAPQPANLHTLTPVRRFRSADPHLAFARVTRAVRQAIALETRILDDTLARKFRYTPSTPNQTLLRQTLLDLARKEPDPAARKQLCRHVNENLDTEFRDHPDALIEKTMVVVANRLGLRLDLAKLPDKLLGIPPRNLAPNPNRPDPNRPDPNPTEPDRSDPDRSLRL